MPKRSTKPAKKQTAKQPARKLKTFRTSLGFFDLAIAAPSMKAALEAWGARSNLFHQGAAQETDDPDIVAATIAKPGIVLRRPVGTHEPFAEQAELPTGLLEPRPDRPRQPQREPVRSSAAKADPAAERKAALAYARAEKQREAERRQQEAALAKAKARRDRLVAKAEAALAEAHRAHAAEVSAIEAERDALDARARAEAERWDEERRGLDDALRRARET